VLKKGKITHWCAQMHGKLLGVGSSPEAAARVVCRMAGAKSIEELVIPASVPCPMSVARYAGVFRRKPGAKSSGGWWVDKKAFFKSHKAAIAYSAKQRGLTPEKLRRSVAPSELCARINALCSVVDAVPWDIEDLLIRAPAAAVMFKRVPVLMVLFIQAKLGPWRALMQKAWHAILADPRSPVHSRAPLSEQMDAEVAHAVLIGAVRGMAHNRSLRSDLTSWNELNRGVQHHSGFLPMCMRLDIIEKGGHLDLGTQESMYMLVQDSSAALKKLKQLSAAWKSLSSVLFVPKTCTQWRQCMLDGMNQLTIQPAACLNPKNGTYLPSWTLRCYLLMTTRQEGIEGMQWDDIGIRAFGQMNPDQKDWFSTLEQHVKTTAALRKCVGTSCPPELLSCQMCLLSNKALDEYDSEWIRKVAPFIKVVSAVGAHLRKGLRMPIVDVLMETAALLSE